MPAILGPAAQKINADTAGRTHSLGPNEPNPGAPVGQLVSETINELPNEHGGLAFLFSDGLPAFVDTSLERATNSVPGKLGGLIPNARTAGVAPGPNTAVPVVSHPMAEAKVAAASLGSRLRKSLGF